MSLSVKKTTDPVVDAPQAPPPAASTPTPTPPAPLPPPKPKVMVTRYFKVSVQDNPHAKIVGVTLEEDSMDWDRAARAEFNRAAGIVGTTRAHTIEDSTKEDFETQQQAIRVAREMISYSALELPRG